jgi:hypothetical protein
MRRATGTFAAATFLAIGVSLGPGTRPARAQIDLGPAGTVGLVAGVPYRPGSPGYYRRYRVFDARTRRYVDRYVLVRRTVVYNPSSGQILVAEVPVRATTTRAPAYAATSYVTGQRRRAAGIGAEGTGGRTNPRERAGP